MMALLVEEESHTELYNVLHSDESSAIRETTSVQKSLCKMMKQECPDKMDDQLLSYKKELDDVSGYANVKSASPQKRVISSTDRPMRYRLRIGNVSKQKDISHTNAVSHSENVNIGDCNLAVVVHQDDSVSLSVKKEDLENMQESSDVQFAAHSVSLQSGVQLLESNVVAGKLLSQINKKSTLTIGNVMEVICAGNFSYDNFYDWLKCEFKITKSTAIHKRLGIQFIAYKEVYAYIQNLPHKMQQKWRSYIFTVKYSLPRYDHGWSLIFGIRKHPDFCVDANLSFLKSSSSKNPSSRKRKRTFESVSDTPAEDAGENQNRLNGCIKNRLRNVLQYVRKLKSAYRGIWHQLKLKKILLAKYQNKIKSLMIYNRKQWKLIGTQKSELANAQMIIASFKGLVPKAKCVQLQAYELKVKSVQSNIIQSRNSKSNDTTVMIYKSPSHERQGECYYSGTVKSKYKDSLPVFQNSTLHQLQKTDQEFQRHRKSCPDIYILTDNKEKNKCLSKDTMALLGNANDQKVPLLNETYIKTDEKKRIKKSVQNLDKDNKGKSSSKSVKKVYPEVEKEKYHASEHQKYSPLDCTEKNSVSRNKMSHRENKHSSNLKSGRESCSLHKSKEYKFRKTCKTKDLPAKEDNSLPSLRQKNISLNQERVRYSEFVYEPKQKKVSSNIWASLQSEMSMFYSSFLDKSKRDSFNFEICLKRCLDLMHEMNAYVNENTWKLDRYEREISSLQADLNSFESFLKNETTENDKLRSAIRKLEEELAQSTAAKKVVEEKLAKSTTSMKEAEDELAKSAASKKEIEEQLMKSQAAKLEVAEELAKLEVEEKLNKSTIANKEVKDKLAKSTASKKEIEEQLMKSNAAKLEVEEKLTKSAIANKEVKDKLAKSTASKKEMEEQLMKSNAAKLEVEEKLTKSAIANKEVKDKLAKSTASKIEIEEQLMKSNAAKLEVEEKMTKSAIANKEVKDKLAKSTASKKEIEEQLMKSNAAKLEVEEKLTKSAIANKEVKDKLAKSTASKKEIEEQLMKSLAAKKVVEEKLAAGGKEIEYLGDLVYEESKDVIEKEAHVEQLKIVYQSVTKAISTLRKSLGLDDKVDLKDNPHLQEEIDLICNEHNELEQLKVWLSTNLQEISKKKGQIARLISKVHNFAKFRQSYVNRNKILGKKLKSLIMSVRHIQNEITKNKSTQKTCSLARINTYLSDYEWNKISENNSENDSDRFQESSSVETGLLLETALRNVIKRNDILTVALEEERKYNSSLKLVKDALETKVTELSELLSQEHSEASRQYELQLAMFCATAQRYREQMKRIESQLSTN